MKTAISLVIGSLLTFALVAPVTAQTAVAPTAEEVKSNKKMLDYGFLNSVSKKLSRRVELTDEQIANIELGLTEIQATMPAEGTVSEEELLAAEVAAQLAVEALLAANLTPELLAALKGKPTKTAKPTDKGKPEGKGKPAGKGKPVDQPVDETAQPVV